MKLKKSDYSAKRLHGCNPSNWSVVTALKATKVVVDVKELRGV